jgi:tripeptide aminopeptidase
LLGADDKAGIAIIMTAAEQLLRDSSIPHGTIRICFTPDEEVGRGVDYLDIAQLGASAAYTFDGGGVGEVSWETFSADGAVVEITGVSTHPGTANAYGMVNAVHLAGKLRGAQRVPQCALLFAITTMKSWPPRGRCCS